MKLDSKECKEALKKYEVKNDLEALAVKVLSVEDIEVAYLPEISNATSEEIDELALVIKRIRDELNIEDEA